MEKIQTVDFTKAPRKRSKLWRLDRRAKVLNYKCYAVDLDRCRNSAEVLDWIIQISAKAWTTAEVLNDLVLALDDFLDIQANYCSFGEDQGTKTGKEIRAIVRKNMKYLNEKRLSFYQWLKRQRKRDDSIGDLARDAMRDPNKPRGPCSEMGWINYLVSQDACTGAIEALKKAWREWEGQAE